MVAVIKSPADKKDYRYIVLDNGLRALLIHDGEIVDTTQEDAEEAEPVTHSGSSSESGSESEVSTAGSWGCGGVLGVGLMTSSPAGCATPYNTYTHDLIVSS